MLDNLRLDLAKYDFAIEVIVSIQRDFELTFTLKGQKRSEVSIEMSFAYFEFR